MDRIAPACGLQITHQGVCHDAASACKVVAHDQAQHLCTVGRLMEGADVPVCGVRAVAVNDGDGEGGCFGLSHGAVAVCSKSLQDGGRVCNPHMGSADPLQVDQAICESVNPVDLQHRFGGCLFKRRRLDRENLRLDTIAADPGGVEAEGLSGGCGGHVGGVIDDPLKIP